MSTDIIFCKLRLYILLSKYIFNTKMKELASHTSHPLVSVCTILIALRNSKVSILLVKYTSNKNFWALPTGKLKDSETLDQCASRKLKEQVGIDVSYITHFSNYSELQPKGRVITIAYLATHNSDKLRLKANLDILDVNWFDLASLPELNLNHGVICNDGIKYSKLLIEKKPSLAFAFHKGGFTLTELQQTFAAFGGQKFSPENKRNFRLWLKNYSDGKGLVIETDRFREGNHRPARIYEPNLEALVEHS